MPTTIGQIDIINSALSRIGVKPIGDINAQDDIPAEQARINWQLAFAVVGRAHNWNCLTTAVALQQVQQDPIVPIDPVPVATAWAPATNYLAGAYVTFGNPAYIYQALIANLSSASFPNDLTKGWWMQTDIFNPNPFGSAGVDGSQYASGWAYKYNLPEDCLLVTALNDNSNDGVEEDFEIMGASLFTDQETAVIKYIQRTDDTTRLDALFVECLTLKLAAMLATVLRQDDLTIEQAMEAFYLRKLGSARAKDAGEKKPRRYDPVANSRFVGSRYRSTNS